MTLVDGFRTTHPRANVLVRQLSGGSKARVVRAAGTPGVSVTGLTVTATGYSLTITIGRHAERVSVAGTATTVTTRS